MPSAANLKARLLDRIKKSENELTIHFPAARVPLSGSSPDTIGPVDPFAGTPAAPQLIESESTPIHAPISMKCLWLDVSSLSDFRRNPVSVDQTGWHAEADAAARVAATDAESAEGKTWFDACDYVDFNGKHFVVLTVVPVGPSFAAPYSYNVWLKSAVKQ